MPKSQMHYNFTRDGGGRQIGFFVSEDLHDRITTLCNITEMNKTAICRYILNRGIEEMEQKLVALVEKENKQ